MCFMHKPRILFAAGGTGGHVYPAIAIADAVKAASPEAEIRFVGTKNKMEWHAVPKAGYAISNIWISGLHRRFTLKNVLFPLKLIVSIFQSIKILNAFKPQVVVACGGYVAGPVGWTAAKLDITLILQEQNSFPGITNRMLAKYAAKIFTAFDEAEKYFPGKAVVNAGNPTRSSLASADKNDSLQAYGFDKTKPVLLVLGGSLGAKSINEAIKANLSGLASIQIIWQCGRQYYDRLSKEIGTEYAANVRLLAYIEDMAQAYAAADLVVSRAGAGSCSELMLTGKASILIPSPNVAGDHQTKNAAAMEDAGAAVLLEDAHALSKLARTIHTLLHNPSRLKLMGITAQALARPGAATEIAAEILEITKKSSKK